MNQGGWGRVVDQHENHTPIGAFKIRGALTYFRYLRNSGEAYAASSRQRGNHGQAVAFCGTARRNPAIVYVRDEISASKNLAMRALGSHAPVTCGDEPMRASRSRLTGYRRRSTSIPSFHERLVRRRSHVLLRVIASGGQSGCSIRANRDGLQDLRNVRPERRSVANRNYRRWYRNMLRSALKSFEQLWAVGMAVNNQALADGMACGVAEARGGRNNLQAHAAGIVTVTDDEVAAAMRIIFDDTHNVAEGAGAAGVAAIMKAKPLSGKRVATVLSGGNVDREVFTSVLASRAC